MKQERIDCFKCKFFYITWDQHHPRGCKSFGFKTKKLPSLEVSAASGHPCLRYEKKN
ncbi:uracil-DNA glycosylase [Cytobacillus purgationiresistens]|uniref:Uracil-DNA glycosylase n=1 Tax=Cytobacillus purgationiresistens TaxID=863449 RepID=A0ABU0AKH4_9BACI|nr:uracil-DNA glycosylase [Cytobacillus purgationiresistens]MDQ0271779.1 hypothetical protein [Cytobacillus purgationiresistens]